MGTDVIAEFEACVDRWPDRTAVVDEATSVSYRELDRTANRVANALLTAGLTLEAPVGVMVPRGASWIAAILGIMKAGGSYVALSVDLPPDVLGRYAKRANLQFLLGTRKELQGRVPLGAVTTLMLEELLSRSGVNADRPSVERHPRQLAYVVFTSGSTGVPKGVAVEHRALHNLVAWHNAEYGLHGRFARATQLANELFDAHIWEIFPYIASGAEVHIVDRSTRLDQPALKRFLEAARVTHCFLPTPLAEAFLRSLRTEEVPDLEVLLVGGDLLRSWLPDAASFALVNHYGPAENGVVATYSRIGTPRHPQALPPIGRPIENVTCRVVDEDRRTISSQAIGELCLSGASLARGYVNDPRETASRFVPAVESAVPGERMYLTGDLVRRSMEGDLQFVGRDDEQFKVRGIRVEPGAIELAIRADPVVREAVVVRHQGVPEGVVAFCTLVPDCEGSADTVLLDWQRLYDRLYASGRQGDSNDEFVGWQDSVSGRRISRTAMEDWASAACRKIRALRPRRVLEIGCGTGILAARLIDEVDEYWGTDLSSEALEFLRARVGERAVKLTLAHVAAHDLNAVPDKYFDTVVMNSVLQYFPSRKYLEQVLDAAIGKLAPGGALFVGDVRDLRLTEQFGAYVQDRRSGLPSAERERTGAARTPLPQDELLVSPYFFRRWAGTVAAENEVLVTPKETAFDNEMTRFRYDVTVLPAVKAGPSSGKAEIEIQYQRDGGGLSPGDLAQRLLECGASSIQVVDIPLHVRAAGGAVSERGDTVPDCRPGVPSGGGLPIDFVVACETAGFKARAFLNGQRPGTFGIQAIREGEGWPALPAWPEADEPETNTPGEARWRSRHAAEIRQRAKARLPDYLVPNRVISVDELPLTTNGKIDRVLLSSLPLPSKDRDANDRAMTAMEKLTAFWFSKALGIDEIAHMDDFFDLGGNSLLAMRLVADITDTTGAEFPIENVFRDSTVQGVARELEKVLGQDDVAASVLELLTSGASQTVLDSDGRDA